MIPRDPIVRNAPTEGDEEVVDDAEDDALVDGRRSKASHRRSSSVAVTDSGYGSGSNLNGARSQSRASQVSNKLEPVPIVWTESPQKMRNPALSASDEEEDGVSKDSPFKRAASLRSFRSVGPRTNLPDQEGASIRTTPSGLDKSTLRRRRISLSGGSFASGAGTVGPAATPDIDNAFHIRSRSADLSLTEKQKVKLSKAQIKEGKKVAKIIIAEGKAEQKALDDALRELSDLQKLQKAAIREESKVYTSYSKTLRDYHKVELEFFAARAKYERAQADLRAQEDARDASRTHARETTEMLQEKNREVEWLRAQKSADDREREAKVRQLTGKL
ncbi:hypothetical protein C8Q80DRAFT_645990 [Daedaleopsis nitida]|nr:hypothetical protein C8Q80DRAFT_645990 [Daedaleopsis nitida]